MFGGIALARQMSESTRFFNQEGEYANKFKKKFVYLAFF